MRIGLLKPSKTAEIISTGRSGTFHPAILPEQAIMKLLGPWAFFNLAAFLLALPLLVRTPAQLLAQSEPRDDAIVLFRSASNAFASQQWQQASEQYRKVLSLRPGTPLALEAGYYNLLALRQLLRLDDPTDSEQLARDCSEWVCLAQAWKQSKHPETVQSYTEKLSDRLGSILRLEAHLAFSSKRWSQTLALIEQLTPTAPRVTAQTDLAQTVLGPSDLESELIRLECFVQLHRWTEAENSIQKLQVSAEEKLTQLSPPRWIERFLVRKAEVAMVLGKWKDAESDVWKIRTHFPECKVSAEVDYVLARCLVHDARFEEARQLLASILAIQQTPPAELQSKVWWITAESHLMQRNFPDAYAAYEQVVRLGADTPWAEIAQRQMAICQQASGNSMASGSQPNSDPLLRSTQKQTPKQPR